MTVIRALGKHGYFSSFNHNSAFYVLADTPRFDEDGLWWYHDVGFSLHRTLEATVLALVGRAAAGCTVAELQTRLASPVGSLLSRLSARGLAGRMSLGRRVVYLAAEPDQQARQRACRGQKATPPPPPAQSPCLPPDLPVTTVVELLVRLLRTPTASPASLSQALQARGLTISAAQVRSVIAFYGLEKKLAPWPSPISSVN
jgi:hypothetical protein